jgi:hypothetical protein
MIRNRPESHRALVHYSGLPPAPYQIDAGFIPELIKLSLFPLRHLEPMTTDALSFVDFMVDDDPTDAELSYYDARGERFQLVFVVINSLFLDNNQGVARLLPYSLSLIPASKRGNVEISATPVVAAMRGSTMLDRGAAYLGLDPFSGDWSFFSEIGLIAEMSAQSAMTDEMGLVYDYFFLRMDVHHENIVQPALDMPDKRLKRYLRHRAKLLYTPFNKVDARQIWGLENALELFVLQEIVSRGALPPVPQAMIFTDGSWQPALYHAWEAFGDDATADLISEVDFFFLDKKLALFCDGATHGRLKIRERDRRRDSAPATLGIQSIRIKSHDILKDIAVAVRPVMNAIS